MKALNPATRFHTYLDTRPVRLAPRVIETTQRETTVITERKLTYRMYPHFHPFADDLVRRLLRTSMTGFQAADTEYVASGAALPGSVEMATSPGTSLEVASGAGLILTAKTDATSLAGVPIALSGGLQVKLAEKVSVTPGESIRVKLVDGWPRGLPLGESMPLPAAMNATINRDTGVPLAAGTKITLLDGTVATLDATTDVLLSGGSTLTLPNGATVVPLSLKRRPVWYDDALFKSRYKPSAQVETPYPVRDLDFSSSGAYAAYNWELFFHAPVTIAMHLSKNQRFEEAQRWFHFVFDPTDDSDGATPERFWKVRPFQTTDVQKIEELLVNLATGADPDLRDETIRSIEAWKDAPFRPHLIARYRQQSYMFKTVMAYLDNLIAWGDALFARDTGESIDEALMVYVLAANILGPRPLPVPGKGNIRPQTYANLRKDLDLFGNAMRDVEASIPFDLMPPPSADSAAHDQLATVTSIGKALYFCVPRNDKLLSYWDTVADRLFKIRNSLNAQGVFRQVPLFAPPIDPTLLARAAAAGVDVGAVVNGLNQPLPLVRFQLLVQKAAEICQEVKSLGQSLLSAMEKEDGEALALLRSKHEQAVLEMVEHVRYAQLQEAIKAREGIAASLGLAIQRYTYYERQRGETIEAITSAVPELAGIDAEALANMKLTLVEPAVALTEIPIDIASSLGASGGTTISSHEAEELAKGGEARDIQDVIRIAKLAAQGIRLLPDFGVKFHFWGLGGDMNLGGTMLGDVASYAGDVALAVSDRLAYEAGAASKIGGFVRRAQEWAFQRNLAAGEINQVLKQLRAAQIREAIAERELRNHREQKKQAAEIRQFMNEQGTERAGKVTNKSLYVWMRREARGMYATCLKLAFDTAKKAERALQHELGTTSVKTLQMGYTAGKEGLLAGEKLYLDIKRMELAYLENNRREYELTKHVSLLQVDPDALLALRFTGRCTVNLPESLFDMDGPGHYFRRIKSVAVTIPCVTGPYASVNCTLTLLKSSIRKTTQVGADYARDAGGEDDRFSDYFGSMQSITTSSAQNDTGMFETNLRDERYLPFEHSGVISQWQLELPANPSRNEPRQFDYNTISDVILHMRYTAREGGGLLRKAAAKSLATAIEGAQAAGSVRMFAVHDEFRTEWAKFLRQEEDADHLFRLSLTLGPQHYPFWSAGRLKKGQGLRLIARGAAPTLKVVDAVTPANTDTLVRDATLGLLAGPLKHVKPIADGSATGEYNILLDSKALDALWIVVGWSGES